MMSTGTIILLCWLCISVGYAFGSWKEGKAVAKMADDLSAMHYKEMHIIVDKLLKLQNKGGDE